MLPSSGNRDAYDELYLRYRALRASGAARGQVAGAGQRQPA